MANKCEEAFIEKLAPSLHLSAQTGQSVWQESFSFFPDIRKFIMKQMQRFGDVFVYHAIFIKSENTLKRKSNPINELNRG